MLFPSWQNSPARLFTNIAVVTPILNNCQYNNCFIRSFFHQPLNYFTFDLGCQGRLTPKSLETQTTSEKFPAPEVDGNGPHP
jgi:hypothetical protein